MKRSIIDYTAYFISHLIKIPYTDCYIWDGHIKRRGGETNLHCPFTGKDEKAHRISWKIFRTDDGVIPPGKIVSRTCSSRACLNPEHLTVVDRVVRKNSIMHAAIAGAKQSEIRSKNLK